MGGALGGAANQGGRFAGRDQAAGEREPQRSTRISDGHGGAGGGAVDNVLGWRSKWPSGTQVGMASVKPATGAVLAIYGGDDKRVQNAATQDQITAGSTFKPFTLIAAL